MIIEVTGSSARNKGAELMLAAVRDHFNVPESPVTLAVTPWFGSIQERLRYNLASKLELKRWGRSRLAMSLAPVSLRHSLGVYKDNDIDAVLDVSGFAFGDQHPAQRTIEFAEQVVTWKRLGKKVVLLPQAFGPFESPIIRDAFQRVITHADLVYARDDESKNYLDQFDNRGDKVRQAPDITIGYHGTAQPSDNGEVLVVPNTRMLDKSRDIDRQRYIPLLQACIRAARPLASSVKILIHDAIEDRALVPKIQAGVGPELGVIEETDPVRLKQHLAQARLVIGSRFHALSGALSSGVPVLATGWSHKYEMLLKDFGCSDSILSLTEQTDGLEQKVKHHLSPTFQASTRLELMDSQRHLSASVKSMWIEVDRLLGNLSAPTK